MGYIVQVCIPKTADSRPLWEWLSSSTRHETVRVGEQKSLTAHGLLEEVTFTIECDDAEYAKKICAECVNYVGRVEHLTLKARIIHADDVVVD